MKKLLSLLVLFALVGCTTLFAQTEKKGKESKTDLTAKVPVDKKVKIGKLDNGLTYYIRANKKPENRVQFRLVTNAGSILEDDDQQGLAHFCEHMAFNGTEYYKGNEMISELQKNGIEFGRGINAWTAFDETVYYVDMPSDKPEMVIAGMKSKAISSPLRRSSTSAASSSRNGVAASAQATVSRKRLSPLC